MSTRDRILHNALELFGERGTDGSSMRELARRSGVNVATIYHHFGSKRDLYLAIFEELGWVEAVRAGGSALAAGLDDLPPEKVVEKVLFDSWTLMAAGAGLIRLGIIESLKGDSEGRSLGEEFRDLGQSNLEAVIMQTGLATRKQAPDLALLLRQVVWGVFVELLMQGELEMDELAARARRSAKAIMGARAR